MGSVWCYLVYILQLSVVIVMIHVAYELSHVTKRQTKNTQTHEVKCKLIYLHKNNCQNKENKKTKPCRTDNNMCTITSNCQETLQVLVSKL